MQLYDIALAYKWEYDVELIYPLEKYLQSFGITTFIIHKDNQQEITEQFKENVISFNFFLDRASDEDENFEEVAQLISQRSQVINEHKLIEAAIDKATTHQLLLQQNINVPKSIIIPPYEDVPDSEIVTTCLEQFNSPFVIKPSYYSGGGENVILNATTVEEIISSRMINTDDSILVQEFVKTQLFNEKKTWFRSFNIFGNIKTYWWNEKTHIYETISEKEIAELNICELERITKQIGDLTKLHYFSTEIALDENNNFVVVDYVNDQCDFRSQVYHTDGVPQEVIDLFFYCIKEIILKTKN